jgi:DNA mismatch repair protein MutS
VSRLERALQAARLRSAGLRAAHDYVTAYCASPRFRGLEEAARSTRAALDGVTYCLDVNYGNVRVTRFEGQADYAEQVTETFQRFRAGGHVIVTAEQDNLPDLNHVEAAILEMVARLFPQQFAAQHAFCQQHQDFVDPGLSVLDRDAMFYLAYLDFLQPLRDAGLPVCYPRVTGSKEVVVDGAYDLALASQATHRGVVVVGNDIELRRRERVLVVTGPNQGGKTTFARTFAQLHWLGALGCPVPGQTARLFLPDRIRTHFDRQEDLADLRGKLEDDLVRIREILDQATPRTIVVTNELFASTSLADAHELGGKVIRRILERDLLAVYVTFVDELASLTPQVVSMTATVDEKDPAIRTYRVVRRRADGRAYASAIAAKYGLDRTTLKERLAR